MATATAESQTHRWRFYRAGGLDLVQIATADDLRNLVKLDQKLWTALACPVKGLEFDEKTLAMIDGDGDGRVRAPEVIAAVKWICEVLVDPATIFSGAEGLPVGAIKDPAIKASAGKILSSLGKAPTDLVTVADAGDTAAIFAKTLFNGDGVITAACAGDDPALTEVIQQIAATQGTVMDRSGKAGISAAHVSAFYADLSAFANWFEQAEKDAATLLPLGELTAAAMTALDAVRAKIDDFFARCRLAAFDPRAIGALNRQESEYLALAAQDLAKSQEEIRGFPLARIEAKRDLPLDDELNPAWVEAMQQFQTAVVEPLLGADLGSLTEVQWKELQARFSAFRSWSTSKKGSSVETLGIARVRELLAGSEQAKLLSLIEEDLALAAEFSAIVAVERLTRYNRDLYRLLLNFVSFSDFYSAKRLAVFQAGRLYLDSRTCDLVVKVADPAKHAALAGMAKAYLAYCDCTRPATGEKMTIAAAFMNGDSDRLMVGRNGIFYDRQGRDWDATITKVVENPISLREAFWSPYKKFVRMIEEQVAKRAAAADSASQTRMAGAAEKAAQADKAAVTSAGGPKKIDVGTVAALGVAVSGFVAVLTAIIGGILGLSWWQIPLAVFGVMLAISAPSMIIAALKLRQRNLGPILDANGWAINGRVKINIPFGASLTTLAALPEGAQRTLSDPYAEKRSPWPRILLLLALLATVALFIRRDAVQRGHYFWQPAPEAPAAAAEVNP